jgi:hypothetical protein
MDLTLNSQVLFDELPIMLLLVRDINFPLLPPSGSFGVTKKVIAGRLGVAGPLSFCPWEARPDPPSSKSPAIESRA